MLLSSPLIFFFTDTATTEIYTLSLHDALPILKIATALCGSGPTTVSFACRRTRWLAWTNAIMCRAWLCILRSEEHTSELQSHVNLVCRLLLEKKKKRPEDTARAQMSVVRYRRV